jgi:membrane protein
LSEPPRDDSGSRSGISASSGLKHAGSFARRVLSRFRKNRGLLLAGGVAYNALLSLIPLLALVVVVQSYFFDQEAILAVVKSQLHHLTGEAQAEALVKGFSGFMHNRELVGVVGFGMLMFFSSLAFHMLQGAFDVIFAEAARPRKRSAWLSELMPYAMTGIFWLGLLLLTTILGLLRLSEDEPVGQGVLYLAGLVSEVLLFAALYWIVPSEKVAFHRALTGSIVAAILWELTRTIFVWYIGSLSLVSVIYGSFATVIIVLLSLEFATIILLLGAQVIAELEYSQAHNLPWYQEPTNRRTTVGGPFLPPPPESG